MSNKHSPTTQWIDRDLSVLWHPCAQMKDYETFKPLHVVEARGTALTMADGKVVLDAISSWWCKSLGHRHPVLLAAMMQQAQAFDHVILANTMQENAVFLAERLLNAANGLDVETWGPSVDRLASDNLKPGHFGKVFWADNGSTAVEIALKMALHAQQHLGRTERNRFVAFGNGYHGETVGAMSVSDLDWAASPYRHLCFPVSRLEGLPVRQGPHATDWLNAENEWPAIEQQLDAVKDTACAVVYEPVLQAAGRMRLVSPDVLVKLRRWADANGVFLIADEIAAGMGRLGFALASHAADPNNKQAALPDFACVSKGLTGGVLPLSAVLTTNPIYDLFYDDYQTGKAFMHSNTYTGHALAIAVGLAVLDVYANESIFENVQSRGPGLVERLAAIAKSRDVVTNVRGFGFVAALDLCQPDGSAWPAEQRVGYQVFQRAIEHGALLRNLGDTMYLLPPLNTTEAELDAIASALGQAIDDVLG